MDLPISGSLWLSVWVSPPHTPLFSAPTPRTHPMDDSSSYFQFLHNFLKNPFLHPHTWMGTLTHSLSMLYFCFVALPTMLIKLFLMAEPCWSTVWESIGPASCMPSAVSSTPQAGERMNACQQMSSEHNFSALHSAGRSDSIVLRRTVLHGCCVSYKWRKRPSTNKKTMAPFIVILALLWCLERNLQQLSDAPALGARSGVKKM